MRILLTKENNCSKCDSQHGHVIIQPKASWTDRRSDNVFQKQTKESLLHSPRNVMQCKIFKESMGINNFIPNSKRKGLPGNLRTGLEELSNLNLSDVNVHYDSNKPSQVGALAYAKGNEIHLSHGQEKHLPHEAWHVVQQKQGRVQETNHVNGISINDNSSLEKEADIMGKKATASCNENSKELPSKAQGQNPVVQRMVGFEFETDWLVRKEKRKTSFLGKKITGNANYQSLKNMKKGDAFYSEPGFEIQADESPLGSDIEFVTDEVDESVPLNITNLLTSVTAAATALQNAAVGIAPGIAGGGFDGGNALNGLPGNMLKTVQIFPVTVPMGAKPQSTVGLRIDGIYSMLETIRNDHAAAIQGPASTELMGLGDQLLILTAVNRINAVAANNISLGYAHPPSTELKGLIGLIAPVLYKGNSAYASGVVAYHGALSYSKLIAPIMARTDYAAIYSRLPLAERNYFTAHPDEFEDYILTTINLQNTGNRQVFRHGFMDNNDRIFISSLTRSAWLRGITQGTDKLKKNNWSRRKIEPALGSMGNNVDNNVGGLAGIDGIILELRRIQGPIPIAQWLPLAQRIGIFINAINNNPAGPTAY